MKLQQYLITDPIYYGTKKEEFKKNLSIAVENNKVDIACYRDKSAKNYEELAKIFIQTCKEFNIEDILLNENYELAKELGATGVHLNSKQFDDIQKSKNLDLKVIISCHNVLEVERAQKRYVNAVTYSPIFKTPNKGEIKGISKLREICDIFDMHIFALGGIISNEQIEQIKTTRACGFASIRYFIPKE